MFRVSVLLLIALTSSSALAAGESTTQDASNTLTIRQVGQGSKITVQQRSGIDDEDEDVTVVEQDMTDESGNHIVVLQQGNTNITDLTQQGRLNNVVTSGSITTPGAESSSQINIENTGSGVKPPATITTRP